MPGTGDTGTLKVGLRSTAEDLSRTWQPVILYLEGAESGETLRYAVTGFEVSPGDGKCFLKVDDVPVGTYSLRVVDFHTDDTVLQQDRVVVPSEEAATRPPGPASAGRMDTGPMVARQINTFSLDVTVDAPYRLEQSAALLPVIVLLKDIPLGDVRLKAIRFFGYASADSAKPLPTEAIHAVFDSDGNPVESGGRPALLRLDQGKQHETVRDDPWYRVVLVAREALPLLQGSYLEHDDVRYLKCRVEVSYERGFFPNADTTAFVLRTLVPAADLPRVDGWYYGDTHYHSEFTNNPYEYGGPLAATAEAARAVGLSWVTVTDHSYCLSHPKTPQEKKRGNRWQTYQRAIGEANTRYPDLLFVGAEEITVRKGISGLHMLSFGNPFVEDTQQMGFGSVTMAEAFERVHASGSGGEGGFIYAAHPASEGHAWADDDYHIAKDPRYGSVFRGLQLFNEKILYSRSSESSIERGVLDPCAILCDEDRRHPWAKQLREGVREHWVERLLIPSLWECDQTGKLRKYFVVAGSDAHMDFNYALRPHPSFFRHYVNDNAFGKARTLAHLPGARSEALTEPNLLDALRNGRTALTDGPIALFGLRRESDGRDHRLGDTVALSPGEALTLTVDWLSTDEFGPPHRISLYLGTTAGEEDISGNVGLGALGGDTYGLAGHREHRFKGWTQSPCYLRLEAGSGFDPARNDELFACLTNPIWILADVPA
jgi:hypothetical protein